MMSVNAAQNETDFPVPAGVFAQTVTLVHHDTHRLFKFRITRAATLRFRLDESMIIAAQADPLIGGLVQGLKLSCTTIREKHIFQGRITDFMAAAKVVERAFVDWESHHMNMLGTTIPKDYGGLEAGCMA